jgi:hypothetical protein
MNERRHQARLLNFPPNKVTIGSVSVDRGVTAVPPVHSIGYVPSRPAKMLTKRRAVDFCRVATAMCTARPASFAA